MAEPQHNAELNQLLIELNRSLLQYMADAWPWTGESEKTERDKIDVLVKRQREQISRLTELLAYRGWSIEFGSYPTEYTDLHYVALDYLLSQLIENEQGLISEIEQTRTACAVDLKAASLIDEILAEQRDIVTQLEEIAKSCSVDDAA